jgi:hypothetical protein
MTAIIAFLAKNWRLIAYGLAALAILGFLLLVNHWRKDSQAELPKAQAALKVEQECGAGSKCQERIAALKEREQEISAKVVADYEKELSDLRNRPVPRRVRCTVTSNLRDAAPTPGVGEGTPAAGVVSAGVDKDLGPDLYALARRADELAAQTRAIIHRDQALSQPSK